MKLCGGRIGRSLSQIKAYNAAGVKIMATEAQDDARRRNIRKAQEARKRQD
ncbi:MAG: hypothetical protein HY364_00630 [Candidatus Aenigmarchaeota archaeon]|nr:hypothetical protein [Candidatus Aenigmarchaeota archaeon]